MRVWVGRTLHSSFHVVAPLYSKDKFEFTSRKKKANLNLDVEQCHFIDVL
jgi:hypothetical protein